MNRAFIESGYVSLNKVGETLCGDRVETVKSEDLFTIVLADGLGSGVKANILSTLTSKILATMTANGIGIQDCVQTIACTLPVCKERGIAYSTFSIVQIGKDKDVSIVQFDNPNVIMLRHGRNYDYPTEELSIGGKKILQTHLTAQVGDVFILLSDGTIHAGIGSFLNFGWQRDNIVAFAEEQYAAGMSAKSLADSIGEACNGLYEEKPGDDTTIAVVKVRDRVPVNLIIGPPVNPEDDEAVMKRFFTSDGKRIVCGGTTATIVSRYLNKPIDASIDYIDPKIPPTAKIEGVDLVTEGVITIGRVLEISKKYASEKDFSTNWRDKKDGASLISKLLFEEATDIHFFVGRAKNPAHQNPSLPIDLSLKLRLIEDLASNLRAMGKNVEVSFF